MLAWRETSTTNMETGGISPKCTKTKQKQTTCSRLQNYYVRMNKWKQEETMRAWKGDKFFRSRGKKKKRRKLQSSTFDAFGFLYIPCSILEREKKDPQPLAELATLLLLVSSSFAVSSSQIDPPHPRVWG